MPRIKTQRTKPAPEGFDKIKGTLLDFEHQIVNLQRGDSNKITRISARENESRWKIFQLNHDRSRYVYNLFYQRKAISRELYGWLLKEKYADKFLIAKWKKKGYENLCCMSCIQSNETVHGNACICRVPRAVLEENSSKGASFKGCAHCGCNGCSSTD